ncbi:hypothetical protein SCP_0503890 [Sparassis crispa]|uniref:Uncharacterized protein n=1 Tax=Sparassis crispa TaxID=139825 RepID=A0A401GM82_9APHY|nr:hypothetical protein SCP_0503890 [Sparassis crispa]GBE83341.1 hypothetical protein SCP_0503890 [Sparassis crispa]
MTGTQGASSPRAVIRDHAVAKHGMDKHIPKGGVGPHNWARYVTSGSSNKPQK